ncbi:pyrroloquinoline quinone biosynthesis protein PqqB [Actibacterium lipolyticum]|uniref:Coenzyme PQQ synthesis protein B n=1 Tax=Actibacterium lipolyticum TaxID=1524263 RepID=A0A238JNU6_9RHOB|nr:pyrroloquinoline quinone biosynthesis protein PqqB [Actibacterium lipolyticum]SMX32321.1 Coenzyme PQQ synthesis protein B [Actibacterium lipolyticum]
MAFRAIVLGAAAGGGLPQWNCGCPNCCLARAGKIPSLTQSSLAVSADGQNWAVLNASPDIRMQIAATPQLHPTDLRESPIKSVLVTNGDIDHVAGLLSLREQQPFDLFATGEIHSVLADNPLFAALAADKVPRAQVTLGAAVEIVPGLTAELFPVPGKVPLYLEGETVQTDLEGEQTVGVHLRCDGQDIYYIPGCATVTDRLAKRIKGAAMVFFDGTLWQDDEMVLAGLGSKTGRRMGHISMSGPEGSIAVFETLDIGEKIFVHMNNTNPVLRPDSQERADAQAAGWRIAQDGMEIAL